MYSFNITSNYLKYENTNKVNYWCANTINIFITKMAGSK